eukprot:CAMPEP_0167795814 /NCGR_PEP_ID=MMETSP0111_2-20121227/14667_1 /TAXON_ID=91324 /ORGANISM="Lotharella globosa, Strain CCCM811" /LENGTH=445 /DNA_ID=CAMNT_0007689569 /DNA_START=36 /DNA_END=1373 /DNA_ORIENTATION=-
MDELKERLARMGMDLDSLNPSNMALDAIKVNMPRQPFAKAPTGGSYDWSQSTAHTTLYLPVPSTVRGRDLECKIGSKSFVFGLKGHDSPWLSGEWGGEVVRSLSTWSKEDDLVEVTVAKKNDGEWLYCLREMKIGAVPEGSGSSVKQQHMSAASQPPTPASALESAKTAKIKNTSDGGGGVKSNDEKRTKSGSTEEVKKEGKTYTYAPRRIDGDGGEKNDDGKAAVKKKKKPKNKWESFDADQALADLENEGRPKDPGWRISKEPGTATIDCVGYEKSKEEVALDYELAEKAKGMKEMIRTRLASTQVCKEKGNLFVKNRNWAKALDSYSEGLSLLSVARTAAPLMSANLKVRVSALYVALVNNSALCHLKQRQWNETKILATEALKEDVCNYKALCRRASAQIALGELKHARKDIQAAIQAEPNKKVAQRLLRDLDEKAKQSDV